MGEFEKTQIVTWQLSQIDTETTPYIQELQAKLNEKPSEFGLLQLKFLLAEQRAISGQLPNGQMIYIPESFFLGDTGIGARAVWTNPTGANSNRRQEVSSIARSTLNFCLQDARQLFKLVAAEFPPIERIGNVQNAWEPLVALPATELELSCQAVVLTNKLYELDRFNGKVTLERLMRRLLSDSLQDPARAEQLLVMQLVYDSFEQPKLPSRVAMGLDGLLMPLERLEYLREISQIVRISYRPA